MARLGWTLVCLASLGCGQSNASLSSAAGDTFLDVWVFPPTSSNPKAHVVVSLNPKSISADSCLLLTSAAVATVSGQSIPLALTGGTAKVGAGSLGIGTQDECIKASFEGDVLASALTNPAALVVTDGSGRMGMTFQTVPAADGSLAVSACEVAAGCSAEYLQVAN